MVLDFYDKMATMAMTIVVSQYQHRSTRTVLVDVRSQL